MRNTAARSSKILLGSLIVLAALGGAARADVVHLDGGRKVEGRVTVRGDQVEIAMRFGTMSVPKARVQWIERVSSVEEEYEARLARLQPGDPDARVALGAWLAERRWGSQARKEYRAALELDPEHEAAHLALGHQLHEGVWRTEHEVMELRGFVRLGGRWMPAEEAARERSAAQRERLQKAEARERRALERRLSSLIRDVAMGSRRRCDAAYDELVAIAREERIPGLAQLAAEIRDEYDRFWMLVRQGQDARIEVRATWSQVKRPVRSVQTGLGSSTSPVRLQLPQVSVASVRATLVLPAGRGLPRR